MAEHAVLKKFLMENSSIAIDTETYGLEYQDRMFALILSNGNDSLYLNFHDYGDGTPIDDLTAVIETLNKYIGHCRSISMHNMFFDLSKLMLEGFTALNDPSLFCTKTVLRVVDSGHHSYGLKECCERAGISVKSDKVKEYIDEHKLYGKDSYGKKKALYAQVPYNIMKEYAINDALITFDLLKFYLKKHVFEMVRGVSGIVEQEACVIKIMCAAAHRGICVDNKKAGQIENKLKTEVRDSLSRLNKSCPDGEFKDSGKAISKAFIHNKIPVLVYTNKGNPSFDRDVLTKVNHPLAKEILHYRQHKKLLNTYIPYLVKDSVVHATVNTFGAITGRFSYQQPNLQNLPREPKEGIDIRECFVPRPGHVFVSIDYSQQEYRLMLDYAKEDAVIDKVLQGEDVHQVVADTTGLTRTQAKVLNFAKLYGAGNSETAALLDCSLSDARTFSHRFFLGMPKVYRFIKSTIDQAQRNGFVQTLSGRKICLSFNKAYRAPNYIIQGGCADIMKKAIVSINNYIDHYNMKAKILLQIHDELLFEIPKNSLEMEAIHIYAAIMEMAYFSLHRLTMKCETSMSEKSFSKKDLVSYG